MSNVSRLPLAHILIESGRVTKSDDKSLVGKWCHFVSYVDEDGGVIHDYGGPSRAKADAVAVEWARDMGCRIIDRSSEEPGQ